MTKNQALLEKLKSNIPEEFYQLAVQLSDSDGAEDRLAQLIRRAEQRCLIQHKFDASDWLEGRELAEYMELDNQERISFGVEPEWDYNFIEATRRGIELFK